MRYFISGLLIAGLAGIPALASAADNGDIEQLRREMRQMQQDYQQRLQALEKRLEAAEAEAKQPSEQADAKPAYEASKPTPIGRNFNPQIGVVLQGTFAEFSNDEEPAVPGFLLGPETEFRPEGFSLRESEINLEANIDDKFKGWLTVAFENEGGTEDVLAIEEAYIDTLALPAGFSARFGRWFNEIGYQNRQHSHEWDFVDAPLVLRAFLARQLNDDGLQVRWLAPTDRFLEFGVSLLRGGGFPAGGDNRDGVNSLLGFVHTGGDIGVSHSWRAGLSHLRADADDRETGEEDSDEVFRFTGDSDLTVLDAVYKWAPRGNPRQRNFTAQFEYFYRQEDGDLAFDDGMGGVSQAAYDGDQQGFYLQGIYQFIPNWRLGLRYDWLDSDNQLSANPGGAFDQLALDDDNPQRYSLMTDYSPSEFSRLRLQYNRDESRPGEDSDDQLFLQYIMSFGAHPAHQF